MYLAKTGMGKFIVLSACLLHYGWAIILTIDPKTGGATPLTGIMYTLGESRLLTILILAAFSSLAVWYLSLKDGEPIPSRRYAMMLVPQLWLLLVSAGSSLYAAWKGYYLDAISQPGVFIIVQRPHAFILAGELPIVIMAILYLTAVVLTTQARKCGPR